MGISPDAARALSVDEDGRVGLWDLAAGECAAVGEAGRRTSCLCWTPDERVAVSGELEGTLRVWDVASLRATRVLEGHSAAILAVSVTADGHYALSASRDGTLRLWDLASGCCLRLLRGHRDSVSGVAMTADGRRAVSGGDDRTLRVWNLESGRSARSAAQHGARVTGLSATPDGRRVVSCSSNRTLRVWDVASGGCVRVLEGHDQEVTAASVTPDGREAVSAGWDGTVRVWDLDTGRCLRLLRGQSGSLLALSLTPDGRHVLSGGLEGRLELWELATRRRLRSMGEDCGPALSVRVTPDGARAMSCHGDEAIRVWDLASGECLNTTYGANSPQDPVADVTADGRRVVVAGMEESLHVQDVETGSDVRALEGPRTAQWTMQRLVVLAPTPDGRRAFTASSDGALYVWDLGRDVPPRVLLEKGAAVGSLAAMPDADHVVSAHEDGWLRVWSLDAGACVAAVHHPAAWTATLAGSNEVIAGDRAGDVAVFALSSLAWGPGISTGRHSSGNPLDAAASCAWCGHRLPIDAETAGAMASLAATLQPDGSPSLDLPPEAFFDERFRLDCPSCRRALRLNPFVLPEPTPIPYPPAENEGEAMAIGSHFGELRGRLAGAAAVWIAVTLAAAWLAGRSAALLGAPVFGALAAYPLACRALWGFATPELGQAERRLTAGAMVALPVLGLLLTLVFRWTDDWWQLVWPALPTGLLLAAAKVMALILALTLPLAMPMLQVRVPAAASRPEQIEVELAGQITALAGRLRTPVRLALALLVIAPSAVSGAAVLLYQAALIAAVTLLWLRQRRGTADRQV